MIKKKINRKKWMFRSNEQTKWKGAHHINIIRGRECPHKELIFQLKKPMRFTKDENTSKNQSYREKKSGWSNKSETRPSTIDINPKLRWVAVSVRGEEEKSWMERKNRKGEGRGAQRRPWKGEREIGEKKTLGFFFYFPRSTNGLLKTIDVGPLKPTVIINHRHMSTYANGTK